MKYCSHCGKQLDENANFCPSCGAMQNNTNKKDYTFEQKSEANETCGLISMILGIIGLVFSFISYCFRFLVIVPIGLNIAALCLSYKSMKKVGVNYQNKTGKITGIVGICFNIINIIIVIIAFILLLVSNN